MLDSTHLRKDLASVVARLETRRKPQTFLDENAFQALEERGMKPGYLITSGNEAGLGIADYVAYFAEQDEIKVIVIYIEGLKDLERFRAACRHARARGKEIVAIKLGQSEALIEV